MATIYVGSARHDENGNYVNGAAGDQLQTSSTKDTKGEVSMQEMYTHSKGWYIFRPKKASHADALAERMETACNNANIGYDQYNRTAIVTDGIDSEKKTECDCGTLARECIKEGTGTDPGDFTTDTEPSKLAATGLFEDKAEYVSQSKTPVYNGDVLVTKTKGHTVIVTSGNPRDGGSGEISGSLNAGDKITLSKTALYSSSTSKSAAATKSGTYYLWSSEVVNGRVRVTNKKANVGVAGQVTGWIDVSDIGGTTSSGTGTTSSGTSSSSEKKAADAAKSYDESLAGTYKTTAKLNMRNGAGTGKSVMTTLPKGTKVQNYGYYTKSGGVKWLYVQVTYDGIRYTGFCCGTYLTKQ